MLVVVPDQYDFESSIKPAERKGRTEDSTHIQETEIIEVISKLHWQLEYKFFYKKIYYKKMSLYNLKTLRKY